MKRAYFIDMDGTMLKKDKTISHRTSLAIKDTIARPEDIIISTGRSTSYTNEKVGRLPIRYIMGSNGSQIYDRKLEKVIFQDAIGKDKLLAILEMVHHPEMMYLLHGENSLNCSQCDDTLEPFRGCVPTEDIFKFIQTNPITQILPLSKNPEIVRRAKENLIKGGLLVPDSGIALSNQSKHLDCHDCEEKPYTYLDLNNSTSNKGNALLAYCDIMKAAIEDTVAIGDDMNDMPMFKVAGYSVAMANATESIKQAADFITDTNENDGVAKYLESC